MKGDHQPHRHLQSVASAVLGSLLAACATTKTGPARVDLEPARRQEMMERTGRRTVPQIYIGDFHVGGYDDLVALDRAGRLDPLLRGPV